MISLFTQEPFNVYREKAKQYLTSHMLGDFMRSPLMFYKKRAGLIPDSDTAAYAFGRAAHVRVIQGRKEYESVYAVGGPINPKTGKPFGAGTKAFAEWAESTGKEAVSHEQDAVIEQMAAIVDQHPIARKLLDTTPNIVEGVFRDGYSLCPNEIIPCQIRPDFATDGFIIDFKTCDDLTYFVSDAKRFRYANQMAFYIELLSYVADGYPDVYLVASEKKEPYRCGVWKMSEDTLVRARQENESAMERLIRCEMNNVWPTGYEDLQIFVD